MDVQAPDFDIQKRETGVRGERVPIIKPTWEYLDKLAKLNRWHIYRIRGARIYRKENIKIRVMRVPAGWKLAIFRNERLIETDLARTQWGIKTLVAENFFRLFE